MYIRSSLWCVFTTLIWVLSTTAATLPASTFGIPSNSTFDYVVVGGGTAGLVVAARLAEASFSVAVVEAGGFYEEDSGNFSTVPAYAVFGAGASPEDKMPGVDWGFVTTPQAGMNNRSIHYERGKTLGGSSARNYFTYNRPTAGALDKWASLVDDDSYKFENFLPYFQKSVSYTPPDNSLRPKNASAPSPVDAFIAGSGPVQVSFATFTNSLSSFVALAWKKLGLAVADDFVSGKLAGTQYCMNTIDPHGQVRSTSYSFLKSAAETTNIQVFNHTLAKRVLFNGKTATGVLVNSDGFEYVLSAAREVIVSAGAFQSPQLLMVSGVGPAPTLKSLNIPIVSELSGVGQNMEDHLLFGATYEVKLLTHSALSNPDYFASAQEEYNTNGTGMLSNAGGELISWEKLACVKSPNAACSLSTATRKILGTFPSDWPTYEYLMLDAYSGTNENYQTGAPQDGKQYAAPAAGVMTPLSRGTVTIASADMADAPIISPNWLTHHADQELAVFGFRRLRQMMDTKIMKDVWVKEVLPGRSVNTDAAILNAIRQTGIQMFHASVTCRMGAATDVNAVIDSRAKVRGTHNLRVVDASSLPFLPAGHPQALIYALAEKIADDIIKS